MTAESDEDETARRKRTVPFVSTWPSPGRKDQKRKNSDYPWRWITTYFREAEEEDKDDDKEEEEDSESEESDGEEKKEEL